MLKSGTFTGRKYRMLFLGAILGWIVSLLGGMGDSVIAGLYLSSEAVAAVELVTPIASMAYFVSVLTACGAAISYSKELGAFHKEKSEQIAGMGSIISISLGIIMALILFFGKTQILGFYGCSADIYEYASEYYDAFVWVALIYPFMWTIYYLISYDGDEVIILANDVIICVANLALSLLFVKNRGIEGLAMGTLWSNVAGLFVLFIHFFKKSNSIKFRPYFSFKDNFEMLKLSSASSATNLYIALIDIIFNKAIIEIFGDHFIPAYTVVNAVLNFGFVLACAINAGSSFISIAYGEENPFAIKRVFKLMNKYTIAVGIGFLAILFFIAPLWPSIYGIEEAAVAEAAVLAGRVVPLTYIAGGFVSTFLGYYPITGHVFEGNLMGCTYMFLGPIVLALPLAFISFDAMIIGFALTPVFSLLVLLLWCAIKKQLKNAPLLLKETDESEASFDLKLDTDSILEMRDKAEEFLKDQGVSDKLINEIKLVIEDTLVIIQKKNDRKKVLCESVFLVNDKHVRLITKDNGIIFDITKEADDSLDLRCYVVARMMESASDKSNTTTISFNRNTYIWDR